MAKPRSSACAKPTGRPLGGKAFVEALSAQLGRELAPGRRGRRKREEEPEGGGEG